MGDLKDYSVLHIVQTPSGAHRVSSKEHTRVFFFEGSKAAEAITSLTPTL
jgi:hypothetical protein